MKKISGLLLLSTIIILNGCSSQGEKTDKNAEKATNNVAEVEIKDGQYVIEEGSKPSEGEGYLALNISLKNKSQDTLDVYKEDFSLYDEDGNKISNKNIYADDEAGLEDFSGSSLSGSKSTSGYIVFNVDKGEKYELHYKPTYYDKENEPKEIEIKVDTTKFVDNSEAIQQAAQQYVEKVFLGQDKQESTSTSTTNSTESSEKQEEPSINLKNDLESEHKEFNTTFTNLVVSDVFDYYEPSTAEAQKIVESYESANQTNGTITYTIDKLYPNVATVYVKPELIDFYDVNVDSIDEEFIDKNQGKYETADYEKIYSDAEKYRTQKLPEVLGKTKATSSIDGDGYKLILKKSKDDDKWLVDNSDSSENYDYNSMKEDFMGGVYE